MLSSRMGVSDERESQECDLLTGRILGLGELHKRPESKTADDCNDETDTEHRHDLQLLLA